MLFSMGMNLILWSVLAHANPVLEVPIIAPGVVQVSVTPDKLPWGGYWWRNEGAINASYPQSPLHKYDQMIEASTGRNPGAALWEMRNHYSSSETTYGHCDGWAAASLLFPEPTLPRRDPVTGVTFYQSDIKALLTEVGTCATTDFYGNRYGGPGDDSRDPSPVVFHEALLHYLKLNMPLVMDMNPYEAVQNQVVSGVQFKITPDFTLPHSFMVKATLTVHEADFDIDDSVHRGLSHQDDFQYHLVTDDLGYPIFGEWATDSTNPDFIWVPTGIGMCGRNQNSKISLDQVQKILDLPEAQPIEQAYAQSFSGVLAPGESKSILMPYVNGTDYTVSVAETGFGDGTLIFHGSERIEGGDSSARQSPTTGDVMVPAKVSKLQSIEIKNTTQHPIEGSFKITRFRYFDLG
jgi:hypothetical protein